MCMAFFAFSMGGSENTVISTETSSQIHVSNGTGDKEAGHRLSGAIWLDRKTYNWIFYSKQEIQDAEEEKKENVSMRLETVFLLPATIKDYFVLIWRYMKFASCVMLHSTVCVTSSDVLCSLVVRTVSSTHRQTGGAVLGDAVFIVGLPRIPWSRTPGAVALLLGLLERKTARERNAGSLWSIN